MSQDERNRLAELKYKEQQQTITSTEQTELDDLRDTYQCD